MINYGAQQFEQSFTYLYMMAIATEDYRQRQARYASANDNYIEWPR